MLLRRLLDALPEACVSGPTDIHICDIAYDSRRVTPGALFVAVPSVGGDERSGGYRYLAEVVSRGAAAVVIQGNSPFQAGTPEGSPTTVHVPDARSALADLAAEFFNHPSKELQVYAVTGTDGKTTTTYLLEQIFASAGYCTGMVGTVEYKVGDERVHNVDRTTTPESLDMQGLLRRMVDTGVSHAVIEASSHALALQRLRGCCFAACGLTNVTADHLEFHGSWAAYFAAKASLFTELGRGSPAVLNHDDRHFARLAAMAPGSVLTYGMSSEADVQATAVEAAAGGSRFRLHAGNKQARVSLPLPCGFNISNALAAAGLALISGMPLDAIARGLSVAHAPPGRLQRVVAGQDFDVLVDYAHTMHAFQSVLAALRERTPRPKRLIAVFGAAGNRDRAKRPVLACIAREYADFFIITNEDPFGERPEAIMEEIAAGLPRDEEGVRFERVEDRAAAIQMALARARPGDTVVILGKGHEQSIVVNGYREPWSDVAAVYRALEGMH